MSDEKKLTRNTVEEISEEELNNETSNIDEEEDGTKSDSGGGSPNYRNKYKELKEAEYERLKKSVKDNLSTEAQSVVNLEDKTLDEIIEKLKNVDVGRDKGTEMQNFKTIRKNIILTK